MADIFDFPTERIVYGNITNTDPSKPGGEPVFVSDILASQQLGEAALRALAGIDYTVDTFYILQGLDYNAGIYGDGIIYFRATSDSVGRFYFVASFSEGSAILPNAPTGENAKLYTDAVIRPTYNYYTASPAAYSAGITTPIFTGYMNAYRLSNFYFKGQIDTLNINVTTILSNYVTVAAMNGAITAAISSRSPSVIGEVKTIYATTAFAANFDGTGLGTVSPWVGWALMNGSNGTVNMAGRSLIGVGTGTDVNSVSKTFAAQAQGGEFEHTLTQSELPSFSFEQNVKTLNQSGSSTACIVPSADNTGTQTLFIEIPGGDDAHNNIQPYLAVYYVQRIA